MWIVHPSKTIQLGGVKFGANGEESDVPFPRVESPKVPSREGVIASGTCQPGVMRLPAAIHKCCPWCGTVEIQNKSKLMYPNLLPLFFRPFLYGVTGLVLV